jgi:hypothetical protein
MHRILFAGIDGSGKTACMQALVSRLEPAYRIVKIGNCDPCLCFQGRTTPVCPKLVVALRLDRGSGFVRLAKRLHLYGVLLAWSYAYNWLLSRYVQLLRKGDLVVYETDMLLHPSVYITYHLPFSRRIKDTLRFRLAQALFGSGADCSIFYLDVEPETAMRRIRGRTDEVHAHENLGDLRKLKDEFDRMVQVAAHAGFGTFRIDTNVKALNEVVDEIQAIVTERAGLR